MAGFKHIGWGDLMIFHFKKSKLLALIFTFLFLILGVMLFTKDLQITQGQEGKEGDNTVYDVVISNGRVMDPETNLDQTGLNVGIKDGRIIRLSKDSLSGKRVIDATGLVVAPGFIDPLSYNPNSIGVWYKLADGVTTNLSLHGGTINPQIYFNHYEGKKLPINYGVSFFVAEHRVSLGIDRYQPASSEQIEMMVKKAEQALLDGAMAISFSLEYYPGTTREEIIPLMELAARYNVPVFFHVRYSTMYGEGGNNIDALKEVIGYARETGAAIHIDHINSTGGTFSMEESLNLIQKARDEGLDVTACTYPYTYWGTRLSSARFDKGWQERFQIDYDDLQLIGHEERLTEETFQKYRSQYGVLVVAYAMPAEEIEQSIKADFVMIGSDGLIEPGPDGSPPGMNNHPRGAGCFSRVIAEYVREKGSISLMEAIRKMTLMPARRLEKQVPALRKKGRLQEGMDADIVVFDFNKIKDRATVINSAQYSEGIEYVLVNGQVVIDEEGIHKDIKAGKPLKSHFEYLEPAGGKECIVINGIKVLTYKFNNKYYVDAGYLKNSRIHFIKEGFQERQLVVASDGQQGDDLPEPLSSLEPFIARREIYYLVLPDGRQIEIFYNNGHYYLPVQELGTLLPDGMVVVPGGE